MSNEIFIDWHQYYLTLTYLVAMKSKDSSSKIGAVIVGRENQIISTGYNGIPRGVREQPKLDAEPRRDERPEKYFWWEHAERNAIYNSSRYGIELQSATMYTQKMPCTDCMRGIIQSGIHKVVIHDNGVKMAPKWLESAEMSHQMAEESGVTIQHYSGNLISEIKGFFDGKEFKL